MKMTDVERIENDFLSFYDIWLKNPTYQVIACQNSTIKTSFFVQKLGKHAGVDRIIFFCQKKKLF